MGWFIAVVIGILEPGLKPDLERNVELQWRCPPISSGSRLKARQAVWRGLHVSEEIRTDCSDFLERKGFMRPASPLRIPAPYVGDMLGNPWVPAAVCWAGYPSICTTSMVILRSGDTHHFTRGWHAVQWSSRSTRGLGSSGSRLDRRGAAVPFPFGRSPSDEMRQRHQHQV